MISDAAFNENVKITVQNGAVLNGRLDMPADSKAIIVFIHGRGSSQLSPRNNFVAEVLHQEKFATLLVDLLTPEESSKEDHQLSIDTLTERLIFLWGWLDQNPYTEGLYTGYVATSSGAAAALKAAAKSPGKINSLVCRGGRPDQVFDDLDKVRIPVLFLVGSEDQEGIESNKRALSRMLCECDLQIVEGAGHSFEEPGKLEEFAEITRDWFLKTI